MDLGKLTALQLAEKIKQHQISVLPLQIAKGGAEDGKFRVHKCA